MKRLWFAAAIALGAVACGQGTTGGTDAGTNTEYDCTGATKVTTAQIQADIAQPRCVSCHNGTNEASYPGDYSDAAKLQTSVGKASPQYSSPAGSTLKVVDPNHPENSTFYLKVLGGGAAHKGPKGEPVGGMMPQGSNPLEAQDLAKIKNWICTGASAQ